MIPRRLEKEAELALSPVYSMRRPNIIIANKTGVKTYLQNLTLLNRLPTVLAMEVLFLV